MESVNAARRSFAPPSLRLDYGRRTLRCGEQDVALPPQLLAWYAWLAQRRRQRTDKNGHVTWRDPGIAGEFLAEYLRVTGPMAHDYETAARNLNQGMTEEFFEEKKSRTNRLLRRALGLAAPPYLIATSGRRPTRRSGLTLDPEMIAVQYEGSSHDD